MTSGYSESSTFLACLAAGLAEAGRPLSSTGMKGLRVDWNLLEEDDHDYE